MMNPCGKGWTLNCRVFGYTHSYSDEKIPHPHDHQKGWGVFFTLRFALRMAIFDIICLYKRHKVHGVRLKVQGTGYFVFCPCAVRLAPCAVFNDKETQIMKNPANSTNTVVDPVCGMEVDPCTTRWMTTYEDINFYFCAEGCRRAFEQDPKKYSGPKAAKKKGLWGRYLIRLNKATGGKSMSCH